MNYYETLGVPRDAKPEEIKRAYRKKARMAHPDKGGDTQAMVALNRAYETLGNERKRAYYDLHGEDEKLGTVEQAAMHCLWQMLMSFAQQAPESFDFVNQLREQVSTNRATVSQSERKFRAEIKKLEKQRKCIRRKGGKENLLDRAFEQRIAQLTAQVAEIPNALAVADKCLEVLKDYENAATAPDYLQQQSPFFAIVTGYQR